MKSPIRTLQTVAVLSAIFALPQLASAIASKAYTTSQTATSASVPSGAANSNVSTITITMGSSVTGGGGVSLGNLAVSPSGAGVGAFFSSTGPFTSSPGTPTLTITNTAAAAAQTYTVTFTAQSLYASALGTNLNTGANVSGTAPLAESFSYTVSAPVSFVPAIVWTPAGVNTNWSTVGNWSAGASPVSSNDVDFYDAGATNAAGTVDNVVNSSLTIGSLTYGQTNGNNFHTTLIASSVTLTVGGDTNGLVAGTGSDTNVVTVNTIKGANATLNVTNAASSVNVSQSHALNGATASAILDMSGLDNFTATVSRLLVGTDVSLKGAGGMLNLAKTNTIALTAFSTAPQIDVGDNSQSLGNTGTNSFLVLGQTNGFYVDSIAVGRAGVPPAAARPCILTPHSVLRPHISVAQTAVQAGWGLGQSATPTRPRAAAVPPQTISVWGRWTPWWARCMWARVRPRAVAAPAEPGRLPSVPGRLISTPFKWATQPLPEMAALATEPSMQTAGRSWSIRFSS